MRSHEAGALHGQSGDRGPAWLRTPEDPNELVPHLWAVQRLQGRRCPDRCGRVGDRSRRRVRHADLHRRRGRLPPSRARLQGSVPRRRRVLRRQGVPVRRRGPVDRRGGPQPRRLHRWRARRRDQGGVPARAHRPARQQQVGRRAAPSARDRGRPHHHRLGRGDRAARARWLPSSVSRLRSWCG